LPEEKTKNQYHHGWFLRVIDECRMLFGFGLIKAERDDVLHVSAA
jgi:hypothetical protein